MNVQLYGLRLDQYHLHQEPVMNYINLYILVRAFPTPVVSRYLPTDLSIWYELHEPIPAQNCIGMALMLVFVSNRQ